MRTLQDTYGSKAFTVLAFPCNQFGAQEPAPNAEILAFATTRYGVNFPMFEKVDVNGTTACALYQFLKSAKPDETGKPDIPWNFTKFLVDGAGNVVARYAPTVTPEAIGTELAKLLP